MNERITTTIAEIRRGALNQEAAEEMAKVIQAVRETGKAGKLTITIDVKPLANHEGAVTVRGKATGTLPRVDSKDEVFFTTDGGELTRNHPKQDELPGLKVVPMTPSTNRASNG